MAKPSAELIHEAYFNSKSATVSKYHKISDKQEKTASHTQPDRVEREFSKPSYSDCNSSQIKRHPSKNKQVNLCWINPPQHPDWRRRDMCDIWYDVLQRSHRSLNRCSSTRPTFSSLTDTVNQAPTKLLGTGLNVAASWLSFIHISQFYMYAWKTIMHKIVLK